MIVSGRIGAVDHFQVAMAVAAEVFTVRNVCGFGSRPPDGVIALDDIFEPGTATSARLTDSEDRPAANPADEIAVITWDLTADGPVPVARSHAELLAAGVAILLEGRLEQDTVILSTVLGSSFAGLAASTIPWLLLGGTLALHHPFDPAAFVAQIESVHCGAILVPGALATQFARAGTLAGCQGLKVLLGVWRTPERLLRAPAWSDASIGMIDLRVFGETGLIASRRGADGAPAAIPLGPVTAPSGPDGALVIAEVQMTPKSTVAMRGPMVPRHPFPPGAELVTVPHLGIPADGFVDTGYTCRPGPDGVTLIVTGPPPGIVSVGGYRFLAGELDEIAARVEGGGTLAALPDAYAGHRLAGSAGDPASVARQLAEIGTNPLVAGAFGDEH